MSFLATKTTTTTTRSVLDETSEMTTTYEASVLDRIVVHTEPKSFSQATRSCTDSIGRNGHLFHEFEWTADFLNQLAGKMVTEAVKCAWVGMYKGPNDTKWRTVSGGFATYAVEEFIDEENSNPEGHYLMMFENTLARAGNDDSNPYLCIY